MKKLTNIMNIILFTSMLMFIFSGIYTFNRQEAYSQGLSIGGIGTAITPCEPPAGCPPANCTYTKYQSLAVTPYGGHLPLAMPYICVETGGTLPGLVGTPLNPGVTLLGLFQTLTPVAIPMGSVGSY